MTAAPPTLVLTRHAKSSWDDPDLADHDRPLSARGRKAAPRMARWIAARVRPDTVLVSSARRAVETWAEMESAFDPPPECRVLPALYHATPERMLSLLRTAAGRCVLVVGHNPGLANLAARLVAAPPDHPDFRRFPTAATLIARLSAPTWADLEFGGARPVAFAVPRALRKDGSEKGGGGAAPRS